MRGIDEETLLAVRASLAAEGLNTDVIDALISLKIRELNPWLPIDESTPKDKNIWLYYETYYPCVGSWCSLSGAFQPKVDPEDYDERPTHYQELPDDPEPGDKNG